MREFFLENRFQEYRTFLDYEWARSIDEQTTKGTPLEEVFFDLQWAWKGAANTFYMPWLMVSTNNFLPQFCSWHCAHEIFIWPWRA